jgi:hypothetical protein
MTITTIVKLNREGKLEIPPEILQQLQPLTEYEISITEKENYLPKKNQKLTLDELFERIDKTPPDTEQPTLEEISEIVKEVRQELWSK